MKTFLVQLDKIAKILWPGSCGAQTYASKCLQTLGFHMRKHEVCYAIGAERYKNVRDRHIASDPDILGGTLVITGTRITVYAVLGRLQDGDSVGRSRGGLSGSSAGGLHGR